MLYHVTTKKRIKSILNDGFLKPANGKTVLSQWEGAWMPRRGRVYLSRNPGAIARYGSTRGAHYLITIDESNVKQLDIDEDEFNDLIYCATTGFSNFEDMWMKNSVEYQRLVKSFARYFRKFYPRSMGDMGYSDVLLHTKRNYKTIMEALDEHPRIKRRLWELAYRVCHVGKVKISKAYEIQNIGSNPHLLDGNNLLKSKRLTLKEKA